MITYIEFRKYPAKVGRLRETSNTKFLTREWNYHRLVDDKILNRQKGDTSQLVLPYKHQHPVLKSLHNDMGHLGTSCVFQLARDRFYWPRMKDIEAYCTKICSCLKQKRPERGNRVPMEHLDSSAPFENFDLY